MATLGLDRSSFQANLLKSQNYARQAGQGMASALTRPLQNAMAAFGAGILLRGAFEMAGRIKDVAEQFRISTDTMQRWDIAAKEVGMTAEDIGNALNRVKKARSEAVEKGVLGGFAEFGISMEALRNSTLTTEQVLERMVEVAGGGRIKDAQDVAGMELMGKSGARILSAFEQLHKLGPVSLMKPNQVEEMDQALKGYEKLLRLSKTFVGGSFTGWSLLFNHLKDEVVTSWREKVLSGAPGRNAPRGSGPRPGGATTDTPWSPVVEVMSEQSKTEMRRVQLQIAEKIFQNSLKTMSAEEKRAQLNAEIAKHLKASETAFENADWLKGYEEKLKAEELRSGLLGGKGDPMKQMHADRNALQRIGAYAPGEDHAVEVQRQILQHVAKIAGRADHNQGGPGIRGF